MLNISTFNIENDYQVYSSDKAKTIIKYLTNYNIDILALQEVHSKLSADLQVELEKISYKMNGDFRFYLKRLLNKYNEQVPIITNKHIINTKTTHLPSFPSPLKRIVTKTIISYQEQPISIYNIHLDYKFSSVKERELQKLLRILKKETNPIILLGDFNLKTNNDMFIKFIKELEKLNIKRVEANEKTLKASKYNRAIDHIFISDIFKVHKISIIKSFDISDHYPVLIALDFTEN